MTRTKRAPSLAIPSLLACLLALAASAAVAQEGSEPTEPAANPFGPAPAEEEEEEEEEAPAARRRPAPAAPTKQRPARPAPEPAPQPRPAPQQRPAPQPAPQQAAPTPEQSPRPILRQAPQPEVEDTSAGQLAPPSDEAMDEALDEAIEGGIADDDLVDPEGAEEVGDHIVDQHGVLDEGLAAEDDAPAEALEVAEAPPGAMELDEEHEVEEAAGHDVHFDPSVFGMQALNFLVWIAILVFLGRKPLSEFLRNRRLAVEEGLEEAKRVKAEATAKYDEYSERLERLDEELEKLRTEMIQAGEAERDRIISEAESRAARMRKDAQFVIDQQMKQLRADLTKEAIEAAVSAAEQVLVDQTAAADQQKLADAYLARLDEEARA